MTKPYGLLRLLALTLGLAAVTPTPAACRTWRVMRDGTGDCTVIQTAVDAASPGDTILVGPGRYFEHAPFWPGPGPSADKTWPKETHVAVTVDSLTIRGVDRDQVIIGPERAAYTSQGPLGIVNLAVGRRLTIQNLTIENLFNGCYVYGQVTVENCTFKSSDQGIIHWEPSSLHVSGCQFIGNNTGVLAVTGTTSPVVTHCSFSSNDIAVVFSWTTNGLVEECTFSNDYVGIQFEQGTTGAIRNCAVDSKNACINIIGPGSAMVANNVCTGHAWHCALFDADDVVATGNVFRGGDAMTIGLCTTAVRVTGNHILKGSGYAVKARCSLGSPRQVYDFTNNYWGTSSADSIRAWIFDRNDPEGGWGIVNFEPFSSTPLPTEKKSLGGVKSLFR